LEDLTRAFYELAFENAFLRKRADEFQDFFCSIMEKRYPADFIRVRPWGSIGDRKNDGYLRSRRMLFQSYAPNEMSAATCLAKIEEDFNGALPHWKQFFDVWVFVHNSRDGLGPQVTARLLELNRDHAPLRATSWGFEELRQEAFQLLDVDLASLLGPAPSQRDMLDLGVAELQPVLDQIGRLAAVADPDLRPVPPRKLEHNMLSSHVATLLKAGMSRADLVRRYFRAQTNQARHDEIAEAFRSKYRELQARGVAPDDVFAELQRFVGGTVIGTPSRQSAVLAVLSYFFEECDIFERPAEDGSA